MRNRNGDLVRDPAWQQQEAPDEYDDTLDFDALIAETMAEDSHLESAYEDSVSGGFDLDAFNPIDAGMYDDDPSPYSGDDNSDTGFYSDY